MMPALKRFCFNKLFPLVLLFVSCESFSQCTVQQGPAPSVATFNTGNNGLGGRLAEGKQDRNWTFTMDSITGAYAPAIVMVNPASIYYPGDYSDCEWISISPSGNHAGTQRHIFFKMDFDLPCLNPCGKPFTGKNSFKLDLDMYADNSLYEIYVNGVPQSPNLGGIIPAADPYQYIGYEAKGKVSVSLSQGWKPGKNSIIIDVASNQPFTGLLVQSAVNAPPPLSDTVTASICEGGTYKFGTESFTQPGTYLRTLHPSPGCDSFVTLILNVSPKIVTIDTSFCEGGFYAGHSNSGTYTDKFVSSQGCDSTRVLNLTVYSNPHPSIEKDSILCTGDSLVISPGTFLAYRWQDGSTLDHYVVTKPGLYSVTVTGACGALKSAVYVNEVTCSAIVFPTGFTPNQDGKNDYFKILTRLPLQEYDLVVYNRFGQKIFETKDSQTGWDGTFNGKEQGTGAYVWFCKFKKGNIINNLKGTVMLIR